MTRFVHRRAFVQALGAAAVTLTASMGRRPWALDAPVIVSDFGARPDGSDAGHGFAKAIAELGRRGGGRLVVPRGTYGFAAESGVCLAFEGLSNVAIEAGGAEFVFRGLARPLSFRNCRNVRLDGLTIRWARPPFSQGDVADVAGDHLSAVMALDEITPADGWTQVEAMGEYERASGLIARRGLDIYDVVASVEPIDRRHVRLHFKRPLPLKPATTFVLRHAIYEAHAIEMRGCTDMLFENVTIRSAPGMAFVAALTRNITVRRCEVAPAPGSGLFMSTTADAVHFGNCSGEIAIEGNRLAKMGDDGVNVTTSYWRIVERPDTRSMIVSQWRDHKFWLDDRPAVRDAFEVATAATLAPIYESQIDETHLVGAAPAAVMELHFETEIRGSPGDLVYDKARSPRLTIRNNRFEDNRARGVLAHKDAIIEKNLFLNQSAQGILLAPDAWWMEGPEISDVQICGNTFDGVDRWGLGKGSITIHQVVNSTARETAALPGMLSRGLTLKSNAFQNVTGVQIEYFGARQ